jgi:predicted phage tail protein
LLSKIIIHSAYSKLFTQKVYEVDVVRYADVLVYLTSMHTKFRNYVKSVDNGLIDETYCLLNKDKEIITQDDLFIRRVKEDDCFYVVPSFMGGGGKNTKYLLMAAMLAVATGPAGMGMWGSGAAAGGAAASSAATMGTAAELQFMGQTAAQTAGTGFSLGSMGTTLAVNAGLALVTSLFTKKPSDIKRTDQNSRQNNMFGSLKNTIDSGTPIMLNYGLFRVAGHFVSGYLDTTDHDASATIKVQEKFDT